MPTLFSLSDASRRLGKPARYLSMQLYAGKLGRDELLVISGRPVVPESLLPKLAQRFGLLEKSEMEVA